MHSLDGWMDGWQMMDGRGWIPIPWHWGIFIGLAGLAI
jgi:hypothetical protein